MQDMNNFIPDVPRERIWLFNSAGSFSGNVKYLFIYITKYRPDIFACYITGDENIQVIEENRTPLYECDCSKEHMAEALVTIGKEELTNIIEEDGEAELVCHFCNKRYHFNQRELFEILEEAERK